MRRETNGRGYFGIGIVGPKSEVNVGTLWRTAWLYDAAFIFTIGRRYRKQTSDTPDVMRHVPMLEFADFDEALAGLPRGCPVVGVEMGGRDIRDWSHPVRAAYLLGAEDNGIPPSVLARCPWTIAIPTPRPYSMNVAVAGSIILYDRAAKSRPPA